MNAHRPPMPLAALTLIAGLIGLLASTAQAQERRGRGHPEHGAHWQLDQRYHHDHYYPQRGYSVGALPGGAIRVGYGQAHWFFHGGVWFRPWGGRYVVGVPPFGILLPLLPLAYTTLWLAGNPYYYANGVYYAPAPSQGYVVVAPPPGIESAQTGTTPSTPGTSPGMAAPGPAANAPPEPIVYPRIGQSPAQTESDRQECNRWATTQPSAMADGSVFQRAVAACLDGRGYTVR